MRKFICIFLCLVLAASVLCVNVSAEKTFTCEKCFSVGKAVRVCSDSEITAIKALVPCTLANQDLSEYSNFSDASEQFEPYILETDNNEENVETEDYKELYAYITEYAKKLSDVHYNFLFNDVMPSLLKKDFDSHKAAKIPGCYDGDMEELVCPRCLSSGRSIKICIGDIINKSSCSDLPDRALTYAYCKSCSAYYFLSGQFHECGEKCEYEHLDFNKIIEENAKWIYENKKLTLKMAVDDICDMYY